MTAQELYELAMKHIYVERNREKAEYWLQKSMECPNPEVVEFAKNELAIEG